ncbi:MAG: EboA domain-containing protein [Planctomycetota bacterium]|nr:EboA domain-containing protein [Planctomycetota bacterium]
MYDILPVLDPVLTDDARAWLAKARETLAEKGAAHLPILFPQLARTIGRHGLGGARVQVEDADVDLAAWRACDAAGLVLIQDANPSAAVHTDLFLHGDIEERTIALRALAFQPIGEATVDLLGEIQRTNTTAHFEAGGLDSNLVVRAVDAGGEDAGFTRADFNRFVLKMAFSDLPLERAFDGLRYASAELSHMLQDFATEREAAGRAVWTDTYRFIGRAPTEGTRARLVGGLEHGDDGTRLAAAEGVRDLGDASLTAYAKERLPREPREGIRAVLEAIGG